MQATPPAAPDAGTRPAALRGAEWIDPIRTLDVGGPTVRGRRLAGPMQGFGSLWQKTYRLRLEGVDTDPEEVLADLRANLPAYLPPVSRFSTPLRGILAGEVVEIESVVAGWPVRTGAVVLYAGPAAFTLITPEGHPEAGWNTFRATSDAGATVIEIESLARAADPVYELGNRLFGGAWEQERTWKHVLRRLGRRYGVRARPHVEVACLDPRWQWAYAGNVWRNAMLRTTLSGLAAQLPIGRLTDAGRAALFRAWRRGRGVL